MSKATKPLTLGKVIKPNKNKPKFYEAVLQEVEGDVLKHVYPEAVAKHITIAERMGDNNATCPNCGENKWWVHPKNSSMRREGGKPYVECLNCGYITHL